MDQNLVNAMTELGVHLTTLAISGTVTSIDKKIKSIKTLKDVEKIRNSYDEIVNELISEREEAIRIAQTYKAELDRMFISDEDIEHLHTTVSRILDIVKKYSPGVNLAQYETMKSLISVETLKTMQLLGFNYKAAIGEPLTQVCANAITNLNSKTKNNKTKK